MKGFIRGLFYFFTIIIIFNYVFVWVYEIPQRRAINDGKHKKLLKWNDIKQRDKSYNTIILGSSRGYCAFNPSIIDSIANTNSYNMCTGSQNIKESIYMLKEILKYQKPQFVVFEVFLPSFKKNPDYYQVFSNANFMSQEGKWDMIVNGFGVEGLVNIIFPLLKYKIYLKHDILNIFYKKKKEKNNSFWLRGYLYNNKVVDKTAIDKFKAINNLGKTVVNTEFIELQLNKMNRICHENDIKLICIRSPYPPSRLKISKSDYMSIIFNRTFLKNNIIFYDLNYLSKGKYTDSDFSDHLHMNNIGAFKASEQLGEILLKHR